MDYNAAYDAILRLVSGGDELSPEDLVEDITDWLFDNGAFPDNSKKLSPSQVRDIRLGHKHGLSQAELAESYGVNPATVSRIVRGQYH